MGPCQTGAISTLSAAQRPNPASDFGGWAWPRARRRRRRPQKACRFQSFAAGAQELCPSAAAGGRAAGDRRGRGPLPQPHRRAAGDAGAGNPGGGGLHHTPRPRRRRSNGAGPSSSAARPAPWWSTAATPMPSPARPAWRARARWPKRPRAVVGCQASEVFLASTGRDRRAAAGRKDHQDSGRARGAGRVGRRLARRRRSHHDHRHLSQAGHRHRHDRRRQGHASTASPRARA